MRTRPTHRFEDHSGRMCLVVEADSLPDLFAEAARGMLAHLTLGATSFQASVAGKACIVRASDRPALLVEWLKELVHLSETNRLVYTQVEVDRVTSTELRAVVRGVAPGALQAAVKRATMHHAAVVEQAGGFVATVFLDV